VRSTANGFNYTEAATTFALGHPFLNAITIQVSFWVIAFELLALLMHYTAISLSQWFHVEIPVTLAPALLISALEGVLYGTALGITDAWIGRKWLRGRSLGIVLLGQVGIYLGVLIALVLALKYVLWPLAVVALFYGGTSPVGDTSAWGSVFWLILIYTAAMNLIISFINQMNRKFGPGILIPLIFGKYRVPREEERVFMFLDLRGSTSHAENLGHLKYSAMIRDAIYDINSALYNTPAEIYQYVGDEVVISWPVTKRFRHIVCIEFFFHCRQYIDRRSDKYLKDYGTVPLFKAGIHGGIVTAVEVGEIKREIAYHGDTINTAARIQGMCNQYNSELLISASLFESIDWGTTYHTEVVGEVELKGKQEKVKLYNITLEPRQIL
jgi:adenylate cyclase